MIERKMETKKDQKIKEVKVKKGELEKLRRRLDNLQKEKDELFDKLQRVSADYANFQKRSPKQIADSVAYEKEKIIKSILPALDNFEHTLDGAGSVENLEVLIKGIEIIYDQMLGVLKLHNVEPIEALGEKFDPALHQAMLQREDDQAEEGIVLEEFQKGYKLNGRVIRPSKVIVSKAKSDEQAESDIEDQ